MSRSKVGAECRLRIDRWKFERASGPAIDQVLAAFSLSKNGFYLLLAGFINAAAILLVFTAPPAYLTLDHMVPKYTPQEEWHGKVMYIPWPKFFPGWRDTKELLA